MMDEMDERDERDDPRNYPQRAVIRQEVVERDVVTNERIVTTEDASGTGRAQKGMLLILGALMLLGVLAFLGALMFRGTPAAPEVTEADMTATQAAVVAALPPTATPVPPLDGPATLAAAQATAAISPLIVDVETPTPEAITITTVPKPPISLGGTASFATGVLHGLISPFSLFLSLITPTIRAYDPENVGPLYDFGFVIGVVLMALLVRWLFLWGGERRSGRRKSAYSG
jgi:hypothetical protein